MEAKGAVAGGRPRCRHVWTADMLTWSPTQPALACAACKISLALAEAVTDENWTCDLCRTVRPPQDPGFEATFLTIPSMVMAASRRVFPPVAITFGTCARCRAAGDLMEAFTEATAGLRAYAN